MTESISSTAAVAAQWWADQLANRQSMPPLDISAELAGPARMMAEMVESTPPPPQEVVDTFRDALTAQIRAELEGAGGWLQVRMDWDPDRTLCAALAAADLADSAKLQLPMKTTMMIRPGAISISQRGRPDVELELRMSADVEQGRAAGVLADQFGDGCASIEQACADYPLKLPYRIDRDGTLVSWEPFGGRANLLVYAAAAQDLECGREAAKPSEVMAPLIAAAALAGAEIAVISLRDHELAGFGDHPNVAAMATGPADAAALLTDLRQQLYGRYKAAARDRRLERVEIEKMHPIVIMIDDLSALAEIERPTDAPADEMSPIDKLIGLLRLGRRVRMHLVAGTRSLDIHRDLLISFTERIALGPLPVRAAEALWYLAPEQVPPHRPGRGRGIAVGEYGPIEFRTLHVPDPGSTEKLDQQDLVTLRPAVRLHPRREVVAGLAPAPPECGMQAEADTRDERRS